MNALEPIAVKIHTYGCKVNTYDSGLLQSRLQQNGFVSVQAQPHVHILNTCAVTKEATLEAVKMARRLKREDPSALVVVTGCAAQVDTDEFTHVPGVDLVVANSHKGQIDSLIRQFYRGALTERIYKSNIFKKEDLEPGGGQELAHTRAFLKIQDGCDSFCTFCVIPFARGKSRSLTIRQIVDRVLQLEAAAVKEVVFTGVHIGDYRDGEQTLEDLLTAVLEKTRVPRLRLSSLEPVEVTPRLLALYTSSERLCRHFHMSIQSANTKVLRDMKRQYTAQDVESALNLIASDVPGSFVGMDVIAGFPGESDDEFIDSVERLRALPWTRLHVFPYSSRPGTFAARRSDHLPRPVIKRRAEILRQLSAERHAEQAQRQVGHVKQALVLRGGRLLSRDFWSIEAAGGGAFELNQEVSLRIDGFSSNLSLLASPV